MLGIMDAQAETPDVSQLLSACATKQSHRSCITPLSFSTHQTFAPFCHVWPFFHLQLP